MNRLLLTALVIPAIATAQTRTPTIRVGPERGTVIVVGGAVTSGLALRSRRDLRPRFEGNLLIALGVLLAAGGGVFAFLASSDKLALSLALGACVMYLGFRRASAPLRPPVASGP